MAACEQFPGWPFLCCNQKSWGVITARIIFQSWADGIYGTGDDIRLPRETLKDWGFYSQLLWGFRKDWSAGIGLNMPVERYESMSIHRQETLNLSRGIWIPSG